ncbi:MAG: hypothetical protein FWC40_04265 [Proteobacteria bacterium]|nr:hypothetical protein [Pseudomonadota bacterium]
MQTLPPKTVLERKDLSVFRYDLNVRAIRLFEVGALFLLGLGALVYPLTHFEPRQWLVAPVVLGVLGIAVFCVSLYWRAFAKHAFVAFDREHLYVAVNARRVNAMAWRDFDLDNSGLKAPDAEGILTLTFGRQRIKLYLVCGFVHIPQFQTILGTLLSHIRDNLKSNGRTDGSEF